MRRWGALVTGVVALASLAGCTGAPHPSPSATALPSGITATLVQLSADVAGRQAQVQIHNGADDTLRVGYVDVEDPRFAGTAHRVVDRESEIAAGRTVNVRVQLPPTNCGAPEALSGSDSTMVEVEFGVGAAESIARMEIVDTFGFLRDLHRSECPGGALAETAPVSIASFTPDPADETGPV